MLVEGRVESVGVHKKDGIKYAVIEVTDVRFSGSTDTINIGNNDDFEPGEYVDIQITRRGAGR